MSMLGRRGLLKAAGLLPLAPKHKKGPDPVTWSNQQFQLLVVSAVPGGFSGEFKYSPGPGFGNLIGSSAAAAGTDPFGNAFLAGDTTYANLGGTFFAKQNNGAADTFYTAATEAGPWSQVAAIAWSGVNNALVVQALGSGTGNLALVPGAQVLVGETTSITSALLEVRGTVATSGTVEAIVSGTLETWHAATLDAGFTGVGSPLPGFEFEPVNGGRVRLRGVVDLTANEPSGTAMFTLPSGYRPAFTSAYSTPNNLSGAVLGAADVTVAPSGAVALGAPGTAGNFVQLDGIVIELD